MAFTEAERVQIRRWLGFPSTFQNSYPRLETAITAAQARSEGGTTADNSTELAIRGWLAKLAVLESKWDNLLDQMQVTQADDTVIDPVRAIVGICMVGRKYVGFISDQLDTRPYRDVFSTKSPNPNPPALA